MGQYEHSDYYQDKSGQKYFAYQNSLGELGGRLEAFKFVPCIGNEASVLDFGCGGGWLLKAINCRSKIGIEPNPAAREECQRNSIPCSRTFPN